MKRMMLLFEQQWFNWALHHLLPSTSLKKKCNFLKRIVYERNTAGSKYHDELSRQLADWLLKKALKLHQGVMLLTDVYCKPMCQHSFLTAKRSVVGMFNRARGTAMISPDDLYRACVLFEPLNLNVRLKTFTSGERFLKMNLIVLKPSFPL